MNDDPVCVTGATGFIAGHVVRDLLEAGYSVRGTVRDLGKGERLRADLRRCGVETSRLSFAEADLSADKGWDDALSGCRFVLHTASPFPSSQPREKHALVPLARGGTLRVLEAARRAGVERAVVTSSIASVYYGHDDAPDRVFGEADWSNTESPRVSAYPVSKTEAERAAWAFAAKEGTPEVVAVNPAFVLGPVIGRTLGTSAKIVRTMMRGRMPAVPDIGLGIVDVRDVARGHRLAMETADAAGRRFIVSAGRLTIIEIAEAIARAEPRYARRLPRYRLPDWLVRAVALVLPDARAAAPELGRVVRLDAGPARDILGLTFRSPEEAAGAMARSLVENGLVDG